MEEDIATRRQEALGDSKYAVCEACGALVLRSSAVLVPGEVLGDALSEQGELCPGCLDRLRAGELLPAE